MTNFITYITRIGQPIDVLKASHKLELCAPATGSKACGTHEEFHITLFPDGEIWVEFLAAEQHHQLMRAAAFLELVLVDQGLSIDIANLLLNANTIPSPVPPHAILHSQLQQARRMTGPTAHINLYRLLLYWTLAKQAPEAWKDEIKGLGAALGRLAYASLSSSIKDDPTAIKALKAFMQSNGIGIVNQITAGKGEVYRFMIDETLSASGIANAGQRLCYFESGIISGFFTQHYQQPIACEEERCWALGSDHCEFCVTLPEGS